MPLVPCGKFIVVTSSHVDVSDHNPKVVYGAYEQVRHQYPPHQANFILQLVIIEV